MNPRRPQFLMILGAMKAGTSALFNGLSEHPEILGALDKEPKFWVKDEARAKGLGPYLGCWDPAAKPGARWYMEGSTDYTKVPVERSPAPKLRHVDAELRFVYVTRNPVDRIRSHYEMALAHGWIKHPIHVELDPTAVWFSNYYQQIKPFVDCFGRDSVHVLSHEELTRDPAASLRAICEFIGVNPEDAPTQLPRSNEGREHRPLRRRAALERAKAAGTRPTEADLQAELNADILPSSSQIAQFHRELDHDLALFELMFGLNPWTGERRTQAAPRPPLAALRERRAGAAAIALGS